LTRADRQRVLAAAARLPHRSVSDGHGDLLDGLKVELRDFSDPNHIVSVDPRRAGGGVYAFDDVQPGEYLVRVTLLDAEFNAFDIRHDWSDDPTHPSNPVWVDRQVTLKPNQYQARLDFLFTEDDTTRASRKWGTRTSTTWR
jgi:hypothetical protein